MVRVEDTRIKNLIVTRMEMVIIKEGKKDINVFLDGI